MALGKRLESGEAERRLDRVPADVVRTPIIAQRSDELVDLAESLACHLLDRLERGCLCAPGSRLPSSLAAPAWTRITLIAWPAESWRSRAIRGALLRHSETPLALGVPLGAQRALLELGDPLAPLADTVADHPPPTPDESAEEERYGRELVLGHTDGAGVDDEHRRNHDADQPPRGLRPLGAQGEEEESDRGAERGPGG